MLTKHQHSTYMMKVLLPLLSLILLPTVLFAQNDEAAASAEEVLPFGFEEHKNLMHLAREAAKPSILLPVQILGTTLPLSPVTLCVFLVTAAFSIYVFQRTSKALAYHILLEGTDEETRKKMLKFKEEIGDNERKFSKYAELYSSCPSGKRQGGALGWVPQGSMVYAFDKVLFDKNMEERKVLGPIQTEFGWHLIWIRERNICTW
mmetsp:Transcript_19309/g.28404  ORF Transcript_19309/g.28404 Transcript_19309/m.28404 type:complete len:205 (-) Transcript_19309:436-1050(-)